MYSLFCGRCRLALSEDVYRTACPTCGSALDFRYDGPFPTVPAAPAAALSMWRYQDCLPVCDGSKIISLGEGWTPLVRARLHPDCELFYKNETMNPTGSVKDRALSVAITKAVEFGFDTALLYSDGSAALSSAAYAARAGLRHITVVGHDAPDSRLLPLVTYGSLIVEYLGSRADALDWAHRASRELGIYESTTYRRANPYQAEGPRTIAWEIFEQVGGAPDWVVTPVGGGGTLAGIWRGFLELGAHKRAERLPRMAGVLPEGYTMLAEAMARGVADDDELRALAPSSPLPTIQVKTSMSYAPDGLEVIAAVRDSGGLFLAASDHGVLEAQRQLGSVEGIFAEPSAAAVLVGVDELIAREAARRGERIVAVVTGSGFRELGQQAELVKVDRIPVQWDDELARIRESLAL